EPQTAQLVQHRLCGIAKRVHRRHRHQRYARCHRPERASGSRWNSRASSRLPSGRHPYPHDGFFPPGSRPQSLCSWKSAPPTEQARIPVAPATGAKEKTQLRAFSNCSLHLDLASPRRRMDHAPDGPPRPVRTRLNGLLYSFSESFSALFSSFASRSCSRSLYPTGNSNVRSSAVKIRIFRVESSIAEQISQCSRWRSMSSRSLASTLPSMYSEICSHTCLHSSFIALSRRNSCAPEPSFSNKEPGAFAASSVRGAAALLLRPSYYRGPPRFPQCSVLPSLSK